MNIKFFFFISIAITINCNSQSISEIINSINNDLLYKTVEELSGEIPTQVNNSNQTILNRESNSNNEIAANYIENKFNSFNNLEVTNDIYSAGPLGGRNIIAKQEGHLTPNNIFIICAHYDSVADYCADDNATGVSTVIEAARILSEYCTENTIIYALWDEEEYGLIGSASWSEDANIDNLNIAGVINLDMLGYDNNNDSNVNIHTNKDSLQLSNNILNLLNEHTEEINLTPTINNPGIAASDHASFWNLNYSAVLISEGASHADLTPHYHTSSDRLSTLNLDYFYNMSKLSIAAIANEAKLIKNSHCALTTNKKKKKEFKLNIKNNYLQINNLTHTRSTEFSIYNSLGKKVLSEKIKKNSIKIKLEHFNKGIYLITLKSSESNYTKKFIIP
jgi:hypothetical protein